MCLGEAAEGGLSVLASAGAAHNAVLAERPDLYEILAQGFRHHRRGEHAPGEPPVSDPIPVFSFHDGLMHCVYDRNQSLWAADAGVEIAPRQIEAMDCLDAVLARPELQLHLEMQLGDIQYVNNFTILHARTAYRDGPGKKRHLLRLWLDPFESRWKGPTMRDLYVKSEAA
jgi:alpha-ketoglutarate-dependent taurine dioxygenase